MNVFSLVSNIFLRASLISVTNDVRTAHAGAGAIVDLQHLIRWPIKFGKDATLGSFKSNHTFFLLLCY